jgi:pimeloyl-ACP methyl ester carboxylesterase
MRNQRAVLAVFAALAVSACFPAGASAANAPNAPKTQRPSVLTPCKEPGVPLPPEALCGTYEVFENRAARSGRKIPLRILVLPATGSDRLPDPFIYFAGGPGEASILQGLPLAWTLASLRRQRDVLLVDLRGTGRSGGLFCTELQEDIQGFLDDFLPTEKIRACRDRLKQEVDLSWYTTDAAVDDVEEVRAALGYGRLNLMGGSYGTRVVLTYLRRHPQSVRTAVMDGVLAPEERYPLGMARATQEALDGLIAECAADPACHGAFPALRQELETILSRAADEPVRVELTNPGTRQPLELRLGRSGVAQLLRYRLYSPVEAALLPLRIHQAAQGDWKPLTRSALLDGMSAGSLAEGYYQSVACAEDVALIRDEEIAPAVAGTFLGDFRIRRQKAACAGWPVRAPGADFHAPVVADVPSLLIAGERDPATPVSGAERVARTLKRSRLLVVADGSHDNTGMQGEACLSGLIAAFIEAGTAEKLDTSCVSRLRRPDFELPEVPVAKTDLERLPGSYANNEMGYTVKIDLQDSRVRLSITQGPPFPPALLAATSPTRFRWEGDGLAPGLAVTFQLAAGKATSLTILQPNKSEGVVMKRTE